MFEILKNLTVLSTGCEIKNSIEFPVCCTLTHNLLDFMVAAVENGSHEGLSIKTRKVLEYLFCNIIKLVELLKEVRKKNCILIFNKLIILIEKSNIRKLVTDALSLTMLISEEMETSNCAKIKKAKHKYFEELVSSICNLSELESSKMRKHPQKRAFLHVICKGSVPNQQFYVLEAISKMLVKWKTNNLNSAVHTVILECLEILIAEPCFHSYTYTYAEEIIELSLQSFQSKIWPVKNAAIQLINVLISRFFGIQQSDSVRLRSFQEFCILFPKLSNKFYNILSEPILDERAIVILQYISSSEVLVNEHLEKQSTKQIESFLFLFENILVSNQSFITKFIPQAFVSLCPEKDYSYYLAKISNFIIKWFNNKPSNIIVNHLLLFKEFVTKINRSYSLSNSEVSNLNSVFHLNNFLRVKTAPYLDLMNIRCFQLSHNCYTCTCNLQLAIPMKEWYVANFIYNLCSFQITDQYSRIFNVLINEKKFNFLLDQFLHFSFDTVEDLQVLSEMANLILNQIFLLRYNVNVTLYKILIEAVLKITNNCEGKIISENNIPQSIEDFNLYESIAIQIILANGNPSNDKELCIRTFSTLTKLSNFGNFEIDMLSQILIVVQKNLNHIDKYVFMKLLLYQILSNCDNENIVVLVSRLGLKNVNLENSAEKILNLDFLYSYFHEKNEVVRFLESAILLIKKFEMNVKNCTFYLDTDNKLEEFKCIIRELIQEMMNF
ncbi:hypothetical protein WA026_011187 [Henosepilachna vigintioctopunctata]|uniref:DUF2428 domain-containing protein n=1 Tax=Henosepilachna vigintioctopunctata TaxID=420089 RepID=A0AAW1U818_9CUCU